MAALPIAIVMTSFEPGGTERQMIELVRRLDRARWSVHVACFCGEGAWFGRVADAVQSVAEFRIGSFKSARAASEMFAFARWCRRLNIAVAHTTSLPANIFGLPGAALARVPVRVGNRREINPDKSAAEIALQRAAYATAHKVVANSRAAAERLRHERVPRRKNAVIENGIDFDCVRQRNGSRSRLRKVIVVANLRAEKGHDVLIDAAADVIRRVPDACFEIVGAGPERDALIARAAARQVREAFTFLGHRDDVPARLAAADIFVLSSVPRSEGVPNAVLEAMAAGLPIVASGVGGICELVDNRRTGLLVPRDDPQALADQICRLMTDAPLAIRLGEAAAAEARARFSFERMVAAFEGLYLSELTRRGYRTVDAPQLATP
jgi:glycosyltransferase involved in cell wall biosynthesis